MQQEAQLMHSQDSIVTQLKCPSVSTIPIHSTVSNYVPTKYTCIFIAKLSSFVHEQ